MKFRGLKHITFILIFAWINILQAQSPCTANTPTFDVDLSGNPDSLWISDPAISRDGACCTSSSPDRCMEFILQLHEDVIAIDFNIVDGAIPPGAMFYQIDCSPPTPVGERICVSGPGPVYLTFCKPGKNKNTYSIQAYTAPEPKPDITVNKSCQIDMSVEGLELNTITWQDISSGNGQYNSYLNCTNGCDSVTVTPDDNAPAFVDYQVCGELTLKSCLPDPNYCDTIRVYFKNDLENTIIANQTSFCENDTPQTLTANPTGGDSNYTYLWYKDGTLINEGDATISITDGGNYVSEIRDGNYPECPSITSSINISVGTYIEADFNADPICSGDSIELNTNLTNYSWIGNGSFSNNNGQDYYNPSFAEILNEQAVIGIISENTGGCPNDTLYRSIQVRQIFNHQINGDTLICSNDPSTIEVIASNGIAPYNYTWSNGSNQSSTTVDSSGTYTVRITDTGNPSCISWDTIRITRGDAIQGDWNINIPDNCGQTVEFEAEISGGTAPYQHLWNNQLGDSTYQGEFGNTQLEVIDANGCSIILDTTIAPTNSEFNFTINGTTTICPGQLSNLNTEITSNGGTFDYSWSTGSNLSSITVVAGSYCVTVTDEFGCSQSECIDVTESSLDFSISNDTVLCYGETIEISVSSTDPNFNQVNWSNGINNTNITVGNGEYIAVLTDQNNCVHRDTVNVIVSSDILYSVNVTHPSCFGSNDASATFQINGGRPPYRVTNYFADFNSPIENLKDGSYTYYIIDQMSCMDSFTIEVNDPDSLKLINADVTHNLCHGAANGSVNIQSTGGTNPINYGLNDITSSNSLFENLDANYYWAKVIDNNGCRDSIIVEIQEPSPLSFSYQTDSVSCFGGSDGSIIARGNGGIPPYSFQWESPSIEEDTLSNLSAGNYIVVAEDQNGCLKNDTLSVYTYEDIEIDSTVNHIDCFGNINGNIEINTQGGNEPYTYTWSNAHNTTQNNNLASGAYQLTVTDQNTCSKNYSFFIQSPSQALSNTNSGNQSIVCDQKISLWINANGGTSPYAYSWSNGENNDTLFNAIPGDYTVIIQDANNCTDTVELNVTSSNSDLSVSIDAPELICFDSLIELTSNISGGIAPFNILWDNNDTNSVIIDSVGTQCLVITDNANCKAQACHTSDMVDEIEYDPRSAYICVGDSFFITNNITGGLGPYSVDWHYSTKDDSIYLTHGTYSFTVRDSLNCPITDSIQITEEVPMNLTLDHIFRIKCRDGDDGGFAFSITDGIPPYTYSYNNIPLSTTEAYQLNAGKYVISVIDSIGCIVKDSFTLDNPNSTLSYKLDSLRNPLCYQSSDGYLQVSGQGGGSPYNYYWTNQADTNSEISSLEQATYEVSIIDSFGCEVITSFTLLHPNDFDIDANINHLVCNNVFDASILLNVQDATAPYSYTWSTGSQDSLISGLDSGLYSIYIVDHHNCDTNLQFRIDSAPIIRYNTIFEDTVCLGQPIYTQVVFDPLNDRNAEVLWSANNQRQDTISFYPTQNETQNFQIIDDSNCIWNDSIDLFVRSVQLGYLSFITEQSICFGDTATIEIIHTGNEPPYFYSWEKDFYDTSMQSIVITEPYTNTLTIRNICNDTLIDSFTIDTLPTPRLRDEWIDSFVFCIPYLLSFDQLNFNSQDTYSWIIDDEMITDRLFNYYFEEEGDYELSMLIENIYGCNNTIEYNSIIEVLGLPTANFKFAFDSVYLSNPIINAENISFDNDSNYWSVEEQTIETEHLQYTFTDSGIYPIQLIVQNRGGCRDTIEQNILVKPLNDFKIPNAFTPNPNFANGGIYAEGDLNNDVFHPHTSQVVEYKFNIFSRWGELLFESNDINIGWDGYYRENLSPQGTYVWKIYIRFEDGEELNRIGDFLLIK